MILEVEMKLNKADQKICDRYSKRDSDGFVHCKECPLVIGETRNLQCKANSHYNRHTKEWEYDELKGGAE